MAANIIIDSITRHIQLSADEQQHFMSLLQPKNFKRKQFILQQGEICKYSTFVIKGCLQWLHCIDQR